MFNKYVIFWVFIVVAFAALFLFRTQVKDQLMPKPVTQRPETITHDTETDAGDNEPATPVSEGRFERCCFVGWAYDEGKPLTIQLTLKNLDYPSISRTFTGKNNEPQSQFLFEERGDVANYLISKGAKEPFGKTGFAMNVTEQLYPGRYSVSAATYNDKRFDISALQNPVYTATWIGAYERRYNPVGPEYILHEGNVDVLHDPAHDKIYPIQPRQDLTGLYNARWSPDGQWIAYAYTTTPTDGYSGLLFNVMQPHEATSGKYANPGRVLLGGDGMQYEWIDTSTVLVAELLQKQKSPTSAREYYAHVAIETYNVKDETFGHPMQNYIDNVYEIHFSPDHTKFLFEIVDGDSSTFLMTDLRGQKLGTLTHYDEHWYDTK